MEKAISKEAMDVLALEDIMLGFRNGSYEENEKWRQLYVEALTAAMIKLAKELPEQIKSEVRDLCNTTILREALDALD